MVEKDIKIYNHSNRNSGVKQRLGARLGLKTNNKLPEERLINDYL